VGVPSGNIAAGTRVGPFRVEGVLGRGGMGFVYRALDASGRAVALKVFPSDSFDDPRFVLRFKAEGETASKVQHENVTRCYGAGEERGVHYIAFELVPGGSLQDRLKTGRLDWRDAARFGAEIASALAAIHAVGIVHRDLKPANVLVDEKGRAKLADFGIARAGMSRLTRTGELLGTLEYMAPELADGGAAVDERADLYSLGATVFALATGRPPFEGAGPALIYAHMKTPPPSASRLVASVPPELDRILERLLAKDPAGRGTASATARDLLALSRGGGGAKRRRGVLVAALVVPLVVATGAVVIASLGSEAAPPPPSPRLAPRVVPIAPAPAAAPPDWFRALPADRRPRLPLTGGLSFGPGKGEYVNASDGSVLVYVPPGTFMMGADPDDLGMTRKIWEDAIPRHLVRLSGYFIGKYEVSNAQWAKQWKGTTLAESQGGRVVTEDLHPVKRLANWRTPAGDGVASLPDRPVVQITLAEAVEYARSVGLRLPTEAEWERAAGWDGTTLHRFPWIGDGPPGPGLANVQTLLRASAEESLEDVKANQDGASPVGALNMCGNAAEMVLDFYDSKVYATRAGTTVVDPCVTTGDARYPRDHVVRGGSFRDDVDYVTVPYRAFREENERTNSEGFRVALSEDGSPRPR
jgi:formylglycine-generating enzyme required for sulfatase activity/predicted Ser/Thr protein kinase